MVPRLLFAVGVYVAVVGSLAAGGPKPTVVKPSQEEQDILDLTNRARQEAGLPPVSFAEKITNPRGRNL